MSEPKVLHAWESDGTEYRIERLGKTATVLTKKEFVCYCEEGLPDNCGDEWVPVSPHDLPMPAAVNEIIRLSAENAELRAGLTRARVAGMLRVDGAILERVRKDYDDLHNMEHAGLCLARIVIGEEIAAAKRELAGGKEADGEE